MNGVSWRKGQTTWPAVKKKSPSVYTIDETRIQSQKKKLNTEGKIGRWVFWQDRDRGRKREIILRRRDYMIDYLPTSIKQSAVVSEWQIPPLKSSTVV